MSSTAGSDRDSNTRPQTSLSVLQDATFEGMSLQERFSPQSICFGCGPANNQGLHIRSFPQGDEVVARWHAGGHHEAFPGMLNGGIIGSLLDCHCNWTAANALMKQAGVGQPPCTVTAEYHIKLKRPTPSNGLVELRARVTEILPDRATVEGTLVVAGQVCATCRGTFVAVKPGHPAYHRW
jgi:acyl-coenzyme A thioesterase PaaI-like protein